MREYIKDVIEYLNELPIIKKILLILIFVILIGDIIVLFIINSLHIAKDIAYIGSSFMITVFCIAKKKINIIYFILIFLIIIFNTTVLWFIPFSFMYS